MRAVLLAALVLGLAALVTVPAPAAATHACMEGWPYCGHGEEVGAVLCLVAGPLPDKVERLLCPWTSG